MKKHILIFVLLLLTACVPALADTPLKPGPGDLPKEEAMRIAAEQFLTTCGLDKEILTEFTVEADLWEAYTFQSGVMPRRWQVTFAYKENTDLCFVVYIASSSGKVISAEPEDFATQIEGYKKDAAEKAVAIEQGKAWLAEKGPWDLWSYQDKAAFASAYGRHPDGFPVHEIGLPDDKDIPLHQAISNAKTVIAREFGETVERLNQLKLDCTFLNQRTTASGAVSRVWLIIFRGPYENGIYPPLYQASILSPAGEVDKIYQRDYQLEAAGAGNLKSWPPEPEPTAPPVTVESNIYYNPKGGKYYHADAKCPSVSEKYLPLTLIDQSRMNEAPYRNLLPCPVCISQK